MLHGASAITKRMHCTPFTSSTGCCRRSEWGSPCHSHAHIQLKPNHRRLATDTHTRSYKYAHAQPDVWIKRDAL